MRRFAAILLLLVFGLLGTGVVEYLHHQQHELEDELAAPEFSQSHPDQTPRHQEHDDSNCEFHRVMHAPILSAGFVPLLICMGLFVAFLSQIAPELVSQRTTFTCTCRGPPTA